MKLLSGTQNHELLRTRFSLYIDILLLELKYSGIGCYINVTFMGVLSYADYITISCQSIWSINDMLNICERFSVENSI